MFYSIDYSIDGLIGCSFWIFTCRTIVRYFREKESDNCVRYLIYNGSPFDGLGIININADFWKVYSGSKWFTSLIC